MDFNDVNVLGNLVDTTFGKQSSPDGSWSLKCQQVGEDLQMNYMTVVHFASERSLREQVIRCTEEATQRINLYLAELKAAFREVSGKTLPTTKGVGQDNVELISATSNSLRKIAYYRMSWTVQVG